MVKALAALAEDWNLVPSTHVTVHNIWNSSPRGSDTLLLACKDVRQTRDTHTIMLAKFHRHKVKKYILKIQNRRDVYLNAKV